MPNPIVPIDLIHSQNTVDFVSFRPAPKSSSLLVLIILPRTWFENLLTLHVRLQYVRNTTTTILKLICSIMATSARDVATAVELRCGPSVGLDGLVTIANLKIGWLDNPYSLNRIRFP